MGTDLFIALINPAMALVFAAAFFLLWQHQRHRPYIALMGVAFVALACGFLLQFFSPLGFQPSRLLSILLFLAGGAGLVSGALGRYNRSTPLRALLVFGSAGMAAYTWFTFMQPDLNWRIFSISFSFGAITLVLAAELRSVDDRKLVDNLLLGIILFWGVSFFVRPILVLWLDGPYLSYEDFHQSLYWITLIFSASMFLLLFALATITAIALDVVEELKRESHTDPLSGLLNRRGFEEGLDEALVRTRRKGVPCALIVCDLDNFKAVNDTYGHASGDNVIITFADCLRSALGGEYLVGRIGGEEFAVLLCDSNLTSGRMVAEGLRTGFSTIAVLDLPPDMRFTASFGVAESLPGESMASLFHRADQALYEAKKAGRDCVRTSLAPTAGGWRAQPALARLHAVDP